MSKTQIAILAFVMGLAGLFGGYIYASNRDQNAQAAQTQIWETDKGNLNKAKDELQKAKDTVDNKLSLREDDLKKAQEALASAKDALKKFDKDDLTSKLALANDAYKGVQADLTTAKGNIAAVTSERDGLKTERNKLSADIASVNSALLETKANLDASVATVNSLTLNISERDKTIKTLHDQLALATDEPPVMNVPTDFEAILIGVQSKGDKIEFRFRQPNTTMWQYQATIVTNGDLICRSFAGPISSDVTAKMYSGVYEYGIWLNGKQVPVNPRELIGTTAVLPLRGKTTCKVNILQGPDGNAVEVKSEGHTHVTAFAPGWKIIQ